MYGLLGLLPTSGENFMSIAPLEIYLLRKMVTCSILILPAVSLWTSAFHQSQETKGSFHWPAPSSCVNGSYCGLLCRHRILERQRSVVG